METAKPMKQYYVYFIFAGYRVAIGKTRNLHHRVIHYQRTYYDVQVLGVIEVPTLIRAKIPKVKTSFFAQIQEVSNTLTPNVGVSGDTPV